MSSPRISTVVDLGAEWISDRHSALLEEHERCGVELEDLVGAPVLWRPAGEIRSGSMTLDGEGTAAVGKAFGRLAEEAGRLSAGGLDACEPNAAIDGPFADLLDRSELSGREAARRGSGLL